MVKNIFDKIAVRIRAGFIIAFLLLLLAYVLTFIATQKVIRQANRVNHVNLIIHDLDKVQGVMTKGSAIYRGFFITGQSGLLSDYQQDMAEADSLIRDLHTRIENHSNQKENMIRLESLINQKYASMNALMQNPGMANLQNRTLIEDAVKKEGILLNEIDQLINVIQKEENKIWQAHGEEVSQYTSRIKIFNIISIILAILFTLFSLLVFNKENKEKKEESVKAADFRKQLENRINQLAGLNKELIALRSLEKYAVTGRIARTIAHEVRNPLTNINLSVEQLKVEIPESENTEMFFNMIKRNSERINNLVSDLLNTTRVTELKQESISINDLIEKSLEAAADRIELKHIEIVKNFEQGLCNISVDIEKLKVAFLNIIVNAIEAMDKTGVLRISTQSKDDTCIVKISDNGVGMSKEQIDRLFEPYFTTKEKGNGLGLANSQNIILSHNGNVSAESAIGEGTTFIISLNFE